MISPISTPELTVAEEAARAGGAIVARYFRDGVDDAEQGHRQPRLRRRLEAERAIVAVIRRAFPDHEVLGEEAHQGDAGAENLWVVDPLDGTNNFAHKIPHFAVSIAYYRGGQAECGVIFNPVRDEWHARRRGRGPSRRPTAPGSPSTPGSTRSLVGVGFYYDRGAMMEATLAAIGDLKRRQIHGIRRFGTASLDLCMVGLGMFGAYFEYELSPWDFAAGRLFVEEAGGRVTTPAAGRSRWPRPSLLASNGRLHEAVLEIVRNHLSLDTSGD